MANKQNSTMSKGWLIIGIVLILAGMYLIFLSNSLFFESDQIRNSISNGEDYSVVTEAAIGAEGISDSSDETETQVTVTDSDYSND